MTHLILATTSPHRKRLFSTLGLDFVCEGSNVDEYNDDRPQNPKDLVQYLARLKAEAVAKNHSSGIVVGFDSVAYFEGEILEKPRSRQEDFERLRRLSGNSHNFYTGIHMINLDTGKVLRDVVETTAFFREISDEEIDKYLDQDSMFNTYALGYAPPEHYSATFIKRLEGSPHNIFWGLPVERIMPMLLQIGYKL